MTSHGIGRGGIARALAAAAAVCVLAGPACAQALDTLGTIMDTTLVKPGRPVTLAEALDMARRAAPRSIQAEGQLRTDRARVRAAYAAFLPNVTVSAGSTRQYTSGTRTRIDQNGTIVILPSTPWSYNASIGGNVELFTGGRRLFDLQQARANLKSSEINTVVQRYGIDLDVKTQFYNVLAARESEAAARIQLEQAQQQLHVSILQLRGGKATKSDSLRSVIQVRDAQLAVEQAMVDLATSNLGLAHLVGTSEAITAAEDSSELGPIPSNEELLRAAEAGPAVKAAEQDLIAAKAAHASSWTAYLPSINASYNRGGSGSGNDFMFNGNDLGYSGTLRLSASLPLFDQLNRELQVTQTSASQDDAEATLRDSKLAAREDLGRFLGAYRTAERRFAAQQATLESATEDLRVQQQRYSLGESTLLDVLASQSQLNNARAALIRARYDQRVARAQLEALIGRDL